MDSSIKAILFDADGMLIHMDQVFSQRLVGEYGCSPQAVNAFFLSDFQACILGKADLKDSLAPWIEKFGWPGTVDSLLKEWFTSEDKPNLSLIKAIKTLKKQNLRCYLATNQEKYRAQYLADEMGFLKLFDYLFFSHEIHAKKPEKKFFDYIWDALGYMEGLDHKLEIMFWDDRPQYVDQAKHFGFEAYLYESNQQFFDVLKANNISID